MKKTFEYVLLSFAIFAVLMIFFNREGFSNIQNNQSTYNELLLNSFKPAEKTNSKQAKNIPKSEINMESYAQVSNNISPNLIASPCDGNEPFSGMCSSLYAAY
jgi:hypothetical protein